MYRSKLVCLKSSIWDLLVHVCHCVVIILPVGIDIQVIFTLFWGIDQLRPFSNRGLVPRTFRHPDNPSIWVEMSYGVELHDELIIPFCELLSHKLINSTSLEAIIYTREVIFIFINEFPAYSSHVTHDGLLVK